MVKLHLGVGKCYIPGWVNIDIFSTVSADLYANMSALPYDRNSIDVIYASHVLEHVNRHVVRTVLNHWYDLLVPGGLLRLSVPNFSAIITRYNMTHNLSELMGLLYGGQNSPLNVHHIIFDMDLMTEYLRTVGFRNITVYDWKQTSHNMYDDYSAAYLPHGDQDGVHMSLNVEAIK